MGFGPANFLHEREKKEADNLYETIQLRLLHWKRIPTTLRVPVSKELKYNITALSYVIGKLKADGWGFVELEQGGLFHPSTITVR